MTNNLHLFILTVLKVKTVPFKNTIGQRIVFCLKRDLWAYTLMCHAEREKTLSRASVMPLGCGTCSATLENIKFV